MDRETLIQRQAELQNRNLNPVDSAPVPTIEQEPEQFSPLNRPDWLPLDVPLPLGDRPDVKVIVLRHTRGAKACAFQKKENDRRCPCHRWLYVAKERARIPLGTTDYALAETRAEQYADCRDRNKVRDLRRNAEHDAVHDFQQTDIMAGFERFITARKTAKMVDERNAAIGKFRTMQRHFKAFLAEYNERAPQGARVLNFDQITFDLLEHQWRPKWKAESYHSLLKFTDNLQKVFHYAQSQHWMPDGRKQGADGCECLVCRMEPAGGAKDVQPKVPFNQRFKTHHGGDREWQCKIVYRTCLARFGEVAPDRPDAARRLATFMQVERYTGARISDVSLMARAAVDLNTGWWGFTPLKTSKTTKKPRHVRVRLPQHVCELLRTLPAGDSHPEHFFWNKKSTPQKASRPWQDDYQLLWPLIAAVPESEFEYFVDSKGKTRIGIRDWVNNNMVKVSSHIFRNTFTVDCRINPKIKLGWEDIGLLIGDNPKTVETFYGRYTVDGEEAIGDALQAAFPRENPETELWVPGASSASAHVGRA